MVTKISTNDVRDKSSKSITLNFSTQYTVWFLFIFIFTYRNNIETLCFNRCMACNRFSTIIIWFSRIFGYVFFSLCCSSFPKNKWYRVLSDIFFKNEQERGWLIFLMADENVEYLTAHLLYYKTNEIYLLEIRAKVVFNFSPENRNSRWLFWVVYVCVFMISLYVCVYLWCNVFPLVLFFHYFPEYTKYRCVLVRWTWYFRMFIRLCSGHCVYRWLMEWTWMRLFSKTEWEKASEELKQIE